MAIKVKAISQGFGYSCPEKNCLQYSFLPLGRADKHAALEESICGLQSAE